MTEYEKWLKMTNADELKNLNDNEINERFNKRLEFGTAGMRGEVALGTNRMNIYTVGLATTGLAKYLINNNLNGGVVIAYDTRRMSVEFAIEAAKVLAYYDIKTYLFENVRPVPIISFTIRELKAAAGIMITASHNPKEYNGYKVYGDDGAQMSPSATDRVVEFINGIKDYTDIKVKDIGLYSLNDIKGKDNYKVNNNLIIIGDSINALYYERIRKLCLSTDSVKRQAKNLKIVYTPLHGAGYKPVTDILSLLNIPFEVVKEQAMPDTEFSTVSVPNPENKETLDMGMLLADKIGATVVIATDPDCDRMGASIKLKDGSFKLLNGNQIGALLMDYILFKNIQNNTLPKNAATIKTIVTTSFAKKISEGYGVSIFDVLTGFKFIGEKIKEWEDSNEYTFMFGYEESYGYLSGTHARDKDAVVSSMLFAEMVCYYKDKGILLSERLEQLFNKYGYYSDISYSMPFKGLDGMEKMANAMKIAKELKPSKIGSEFVEFVSDYSESIKYYENGAMESITLPKTNAIYFGLSNSNWLCIRPSGTEPKLKIYASVSHKESLEKAELKAASLIECVKELLRIT